MWTAILLFGILLPVLLLAGAVVFGGAAIIMLRRRELRERVSFTAVAHAYAVLMMIVGLFVAAAGVGTAGKIAFATVASDEFSYTPPDEFDADFGVTDPYDDDKEQDAVLATVLLVLGGGMFIPHATGLTVLRSRGMRVSAAVERGYHLAGLATATIGLFAAAGTTLGAILQRLADDTGGWQEHHPGEPLAFALVLIVATGWFGQVLWSDVTKAMASDEVVTAGEVSS
jgi:hypothetical protein